MFSSTLFTVLPSNSYVYRLWHGCIFHVDYLIACFLLFFTCFMRFMCFLFVTCCTDLVFPVCYLLYRWECLEWSFSRHPAFSSATFQGVVVCWSVCAHVPTSCSCIYVCICVCLYVLYRMYVYIQYISEYICVYVCICYLVCTYV